MKKEITKQQINSLEKYLLVDCIKNIGFITMLFIISNQTFETFLNPDWALFLSFILCMFSIYAVCIEIADKKEFLNYLKQKEII